MTACMLLNPVESAAAPSSLVKVKTVLDELGLLDTEISSADVKKNVSKNTAPVSGFDRNSNITGMPESGQLADIDRILVVRFAPGEGLFRHVSFVGCSPVVNLGDDGGQACGLPNVEIGFTPVFDQPFLLTGAGRRMPVCSECGQQHEDWQAALIVSGHSELVCAGCGEVLPLQDINWGKSGGYQRFGIVIKGIYPREAVPVDTLMQALHKMTGCDWKAAWLEPPFTFIRFSS